MIYRYPPEVHDFVKAHVAGMRFDKLAELCNAEMGTQFTKSSMRSFCGNHGYRNQMQNGRYAEEILPPGLMDFVRENSWGVTSKEMARMVNEKFGVSYTQSSMKQFRHRHGIKSGVTGWYQKGHPPGNKGKKLEEYVGEERAAEIKERISRTQFKKGQRPHNEMPVGSIVINSGGYKLRKKQMEGSLWERWEFLHKAVWEEHNGPIPKGMAVTFKDSDKLNCDISNLMLITKGENAALTRKGYRSEDPDLTMAGLGVIRLSQAADRKRRRKK